MLLVQAYTDEVTLVRIAVRAHNLAGFSVVPFTTAAGKMMGLGDTIWTTQFAIEIHFHGHGLGFGIRIIGHGERSCVVAGSNRVNECPRSWRNRLTESRRTFRYFVQNRTWTIALLALRQLTGQSLEREGR